MGHRVEVLSTLIVVLAAVLLLLGGLLLKAGRDLGVAESGDRRGPPGPVTALVDDGLQRTRERVDVLIQPDVHPDDVRPTRSAMRNRGQTYLVLGAGLVGIAGLLLIGVLLLASA